ncbi:MAG: efflux RND transporter periplasmic adaptor subunit [Thalassotalea sp.]
MKTKFGMVMLSLSLLTFLSSCGKTNADEKAKMPTPPPAKVDFVTLSTKNIELVEHLPARAHASKIAIVRPQISGIILKRNFVEGSFVERGQALYQIDDVMYKANLSSAQAELAQTQANYKNAEAELQRYQNLVKDKAVSQQQFEQKQAQFLAYQAELNVRQAKLHIAQVELDYTQVLAPISGKIGISNITEGALVTAGQSAALTSITQLDPIYFDMVLASNELIKLKQNLASGALLSADSPVQFKIAAQTYTGKLLFNEVQVNPSTDTVSLRAEFANPDYYLMPGMFANLEITQAISPNSILVPQKSVIFNRKGQASVYTVSNDNQAILKTIELGRSIEQDWLVASGLKSGDRVITVGLQKIRPGSSVQATSINNSAE